MKNQNETYNYKGWLISDSFWKRTWAIYGYGLIPPLVIIALFLAATIIFDFFSGF